MRGIARFAILFAVWIACSPSPARAAKSDILILQNGDRITGEVKGLSRGKLDYSTDDAGRLSIEWTKVANVRSSHAFDIEDVYGHTYFGRLDTLSIPRYVLIRDTGLDTLLIPSVVEITTLDAGFLQRVKAYLDLGFTLAKANTATTFNASGSADYRGSQLGSSLTFDSYAQGQENIATTARNSIRQTLSWFLPNRWSLVGLLQAEQNDELSLDHRYTYGGAMQRVLEHTNSSQVAAGAGLVGIQEKFTSSTDQTSESSVEALGTLNWDAFRFDSPKMDLGTAIAIFPSLSDLGRVRGQVEIRAKYELFTDFNLGLHVSDTFDSRPPEAGVSKNDYIASLTIGWSYRR